MKAYKVILIVFLFLALLLISCRGKIEEITQRASDATITKPFKLPLEIPNKPIIVFCSDRTGDYELYYMSIDGNYIIQATLSPYADYHPRFSPDDSKLVFVSSRDGGKSEIYMMNVDGTDVVRLTEMNAWSTDPCFSPDGSKIVFSSEKNNIADIFIMNTNGKDIIQLTKESGNNFYPRFSSE